MQANALAVHEVKEDIGGLEWHAYVKTFKKWSAISLLIVVENKYCLGYWFFWNRHDYLGEHTFWVMEWTSSPLKRSSGIASSFEKHNTVFSVIFLEVW